MADAKQAHRHDQHDRQRQLPALVLRGQHEEDEESRRREDRDGRNALLLLLMGEFRPFDGEAGRQHFLGKRFHPCHSRARCDTRCAAPPSTSAAG